MSPATMKEAMMNRLLALVMLAAALLLTAAAHAAAPGIKGTTFNLTAQPAYISLPDGQAVYSWGYGCTGGTPGSATFAPPASLMPGATCPTMQVPGPTLIVTQGATVTVTLTNGLPTAAGNTSILFPGFQVTTTSGVVGLLTHEAAPGGTVTYTFTASSPGTHAYYSGTQGDLQVEMGLYGAIIVLPASVPAACTAGLHASNLTAEAHWHESDFRLAAAAYNHARTCYDREYLFQFSEMDPNIHSQALAQVTARGNCTAGAVGCSLEVATQPYNGNPHMHPGEQVLLRVIGQGRWQHPFHEHGNHVRILGRDGNLILSATDPTSLAGPLLFTTTTTPGLAFDGIFYWTAKGLNWDAYGHNPASGDASAKLSCTPDANGYNTSAPTAINYFEWC